MSRPWMGYLAGAAFVLSAATAVTAYAQAEPGDHARAERQDRTVIIRRGDGDDADAMYVRHGGTHTDAAEHLRTMLQLKPSQEPALAAYMAAVKPAHEHEHIVEMSDHRDAKTTPQRLADMEAQMAAHTAAMHGRVEATRRFYDQLEPSQKKVFDEMPIMMGPMMPMGPMKVMVNMQHMPPMPPTPPMPPKAPPPPRS
jgi:periplasmic protein CpxP/Spy